MLYRILSLILAKGKFTNMSDSNIWYLENIDAQGIFCPKKMSTEENHTKSLFNKGDFIFKQEENADKLYYISSGRVKIGAEVGDKSVTKAILSDGEIFGEKAMAGELLRRDYAQALEKTEVCIISKDK